MTRVPSEIITRTPSRYKSQMVHVLIEICTEILLRFQVSVCQPTRLPDDSEAVRFRVPGTGTGYVQVQMVLREN